MAKLVTVVIECFVNNSEVKYEFLIKSDKSEKLLDNYRGAVNTVSALRVDYTTGCYKDVMMISGDLLRNSTIQINKGR